MQWSFKNMATGYVLFLLLLKMMAVPLVCLQFNLSKDFIATTLCENRSRPMMLCKGSCILNKQMARETENAGSQNEHHHARTAAPDYFEIIDTFTLHHLTSTVPSYATCGYARAAAGFPAGIFHPPSQQHPKKVLG